MGYIGPMRYIILFAPNDDTICAVHEDSEDPGRWALAPARIRIFPSLDRAVAFVSKRAFFEKLPYQIVPLDLKEAG